MMSLRSSTIRLAALTAPVWWAAGCAVVPTPVQAPPPAPTVAAPPPVAVAPDWRDRPLTPGIWRYARDGVGGTAGFGVDPASPAVMLRCEGGQLTMAAANLAGTALTIVTTSVVRALPAVAEPGSPPRLVARLQLRDPLLDAMAFSRGRWMVEAGGAAPVIVPAWAEVGRVIEECRG